MKKWPPLGQMREDPPKIGSKLKREGRGEEKRHTEMKNGPHWGKCAKTHQMVSRTAWAPILRTNPSQNKWSKNLIKNRFFCKRSFLGSLSAGLPSQNTQYFLKPGRDLKYLIDILFRIWSTQKWSFFFSNGRWPPLGQMHEDTPNGLEDGVSTNPPHKIRPKSNEVKIWSKQIGSKLKREGRWEEKNTHRNEKMAPTGANARRPTKNRI